MGQIRAMAATKAALGAAGRDAGVTTGPAGGLEVVGLGAQSWDRGGESAQTGPVGGPEPAADAGRGQGGGRAGSIGGLYAAKPAFRRVLSPVAGYLAGRRLHPDVLTGTAVGAAVL